MLTGDIDSNDTILITGATGFVGSNLLRRLVHYSKKIHIIVRKSSNFWRISDVLPKVKLQYIDLLDTKEVKKAVKFINPTVIFHLANRVLYQSKSPPFTELYKNNILGTINLIDALESVEYKCFVNTGSSSEYGPKNKPMLESDICSPVNAYGLSKLICSLYASQHAKNNNKPLVTLRLFSPYGPFDDYRRLIPYLVLRSIKSENILIHKPEAVRDFIYIDDVIEAYINTVKYAHNFPGEIFNIGSSKQISVKKVLSKVVKITDSKNSVTFERIFSKLKETTCWQASIKKSKININWMPNTSFDDGIKKTINWFTNNQKLYR